MLKLLTIALLMTLIYSWEEIKLALMDVFRKQKSAQNKRKNALQIDTAIDLAIMTAVIPIGLTWQMSNQSLTVDHLAALVWVLLGTALLSAGVVKFLSRIKHLKYAQQGEKLFVITYSLLGLFQPALRLINLRSIMYRKHLIKLLLWLSLAPLAGLALRLTGIYSGAGWLPNTELLLKVLMVSVVAVVFADFAEKFFHSLKLKTVSSYYRILLGIVLTAVLIFGI